jgi:spermidine synthase
MSSDFEELDYRRTPLGELSLRRRRVLSLEGREVFEVKLGDEFLMSSLFNEGEIALARLGLSAQDAAQPDVAHLDVAHLDVVVGGLGLGHTAAAALDFPGVRSVLVVEALAEVIHWHQKGLVPLGAKLIADERCRLVNGDFFALAQSAGQGFDHDAPGRRFHAVLLDVDHSPRELLHARHGAFYEPAGLRGLTSYLHPGGVFALWSNDPPDEAFLQALASAFATARAHVVTFHNPLQNRQASNTIYVART